MYLSASLFQKVEQIKLRLLRDNQQMLPNLPRENLSPQLMVAGQYNIQQLLLREIACLRIHFDEKLGVLEQGVFGMQFGQE
jgi:hypothetical protein